jgi:penicillin G amidase
MHDRSRGGDVGLRATTLVVAALMLLPTDAGQSGQFPSAALTYELKGLNKAVEILYDTWGVPHIYAETIDDAFFGQGFAAARDRLWQIDWDRRRALGRMAQLRGPALVTADQAHRLFLYRGDAATEWTNYDPLIHSIAAAFTAGVNSYVELTRGTPDLLPVEFKQAGYLPDFWDTDDFIRIRGIDADAALRAVRRAELDKA